MKRLPFIVRYLCLGLMGFSLLMLGTAFVFNDADQSVIAILKQFSWVLVVALVCLLNEVLLKSRLLKSYKAILVYACMFWLAVAGVVGFVVYLMVRLNQMFLQM